MRFLRDESGQTAAEYLGMVLVVAALLGAVADVVDLDARFEVASDAAC